MWKRIVKIIGVMSSASIFIQFNGCTNIYLQKVNTSFGAPNAAPNAVVTRDAGDTRVSMGISTNPESEIKFNDGNHSSSSTYDTLNHSYYDKKYDGENVHINIPPIQGSLLMDYSIAKHLFVFAKGNLGYADNNYCGALNIGVGIHFGLSKISISGYLTPGIYLLNSEAQILRTDSFNDTGSTYAHSLNDKTEFSMGGGFKFTTADTAQKIHVSWGMDAQLQKYFTYTYTDSLLNEGDNEKTTNYQLLFLSPSIGILRTFGNSQIDLVLHVGLPIIFGEMRYGDRLIADQIFPTITASYTYCFQSKRTIEN